MGSPPGHALTSAESSKRGCLEGLNNNCKCLTNCLLCRATVRSAESRLANQELTTLRLSASPPVENQVAEFGWTFGTPQAMLVRLFDRTARLPHRWPHRR